MQTVYLSLGSNQGNRHQNLIDAIRSIENYGGKITKQSSVYETEAWGVTNQPAFLNQVIEIQTLLEPEALLKELLNIERLMGRVRTNDNRWKQRIIDIDIIAYGDKIIQTDSLIIPHPEMHNRSFVLSPLLEIAPQWTHPVFNKTVKEILFYSADKLKVEKVI